ncbi:MAG: hypothetical protein AAGJ10_04270 [Bacteroidota bacterium]
MRLVEDAADLTDIPKAMRSTLTSWRPWLTPSTLQPVPATAPAPANPSLTYLKQLDRTAAIEASYKLNAMPPAPKPDMPVGRKATMLVLFFVFWLVTSAFFMNLYIARYLS